MRNRQVLVIGSSDETESLNECYQIGNFIAKKGWVLISGGRGGVMEAVSHGASDAKGVVIGILPGSEFNEANSYCNVVIPTGMGFARNSINVLAADIIIAIGGKAGTLSELAYAWTYGKPIICCRFIKGWSRDISETGIDDRPGSQIFKADTVDDVFRHLCAYFKM